MKLDLSVTEINVILSALGKAPYEVVFELVEKIKKQATEQLAPVQNSSNT